MDENANIEKIRNPFLEVSDMDFPLMETHIIRGVNSEGKILVMKKLSQMTEEERKAYNAYLRDRGRQRRQKMADIVEKRVERKTKALFNKKMKAERKKQAEENKKKRIEAETKKRALRLEKKRITAEIKKQMEELK